MGPGCPLAGLALASGLVQGPATAPTFSEHVAPIVFRSCLPCHREGESAPFALQSYAEVAKRGRQIVQVTRSRYMPPWLPVAGIGEFVGERRLSDEELATLAAWVEAGTPEGDPARLPEAPRTVTGWQLGEPDLVLTLPEPFVVPEEGLDVFRTFVLPVPLERARYVEGLELRPGNKRVVHHAVLRVDRTDSARKLDAEDEAPGYPGMEMALSESPDGQFLGWTPGKVPMRAPEGMAWTLAPGTDLILQFHMVPTGKPEPVRPSVGLFFTDRPPLDTLMVLRLRNDAIDIPPGERAHVLEDVLTLTSAITLTKVYPHAHYLAKRIEAYADLPDGRHLELLRIEDWDFNWQDEYLYTRPVQLPAGARLGMRYTFDNSAENPRNPSVPPRRVQNGNSSFDEMATLTFQVVTESAAARSALKEANFRHRVEVAPRSPLVRLDLGLVLAEQGKFDEAAAELRVGLALEPRSFELHRSLGAVLASQGKLEEATRSFEEALRLAPGTVSLHATLAGLAGRRGRWEEAAEHQRGVLAVLPRDVEANRGLGVALVRLERLDEAVAPLERAAELDARDHQSRYLLGLVAFRQGRLEDATAAFLAGLELHPLAQAHNDLARVYTARGLHAEAKEQREAARRLERESRGSPATPPR
jgi:tetratricopeptide (TPR) repeat protein